MRCARVADHGTPPHSYEHHNIEEPAILLGGAFVVDMAPQGNL